MSDGTRVTNDAWIHEATDELAAARPDLGIPSELESLAWAARERGDEIAGRMADELCRRQERES